DTSGGEPTSTTAAASSAAPRMHNRTKPIRYWVSIGNPQTRIAVAEPRTRPPRHQRLRDHILCGRRAKRLRVSCERIDGGIGARNVPLVPAQRDSSSKLLDAAPCAFAETRERGKEEGAFRPRRSRVPRHPFPSTGPAIRRPGTFRG